MKTILVTGVNGFVGRHLVRELLGNNHRVIGIGGPGPSPDAALVQSIDHYVTCNFTDAAEVSKLDFHDVDAIIHLAGLASIQRSFAEPARFIGDNGAIAINLFEALTHQNVQPRVIVISSGGVYAADQPMPINESGTTTTSSPYVVSKLLTEDICSYYRSRVQDAIIVRPFNHIGPGQGPGFLLPDLAAQIVEATGADKELVVGNLKTKRDYTDVRDVARAYRLLATAPQLNSTLYNVCSGKSVAGEQILQLLLEQLAPGKKPAVKVDKTRFRPTDAPEIAGNSSRLQQELGWRPAIGLEQTVKDFIASLGATTI
jgi:GDP-4-dehydro-6-deoxy-D-mannose reductase